MNTMSFEDSIRNTIKNKLNPYTEATMKKKAELEGQYYADPSTLYDSFRSDVEDPFERRRLVEGERQRLYQGVSSMGDILDNRETNINDIVTSFVNARAEQNQADQQAWQRKMDLEQLAISKANLGLARASAAKEQSDWEQLAAIYGPETARKILAMKLTGGTTLDEITGAGGGGGGGGQPQGGSLFSSPTVRGAAGFVAGRMAGARAGAMLGAGAGPYGSLIGGIGGAILGAEAPKIYSALRSRLGL